LGVVLEVPSGGAYDTLAAYADGSARYLNFSGKAIFWDAPDPKVKELCLAMVGLSFDANTQDPTAEGFVPTQRRRSGDVVDTLGTFHNYRTGAQSFTCRRLAHE
jgi:hypothetical protein